MANISADSNIVAIAKTVYTGKRFESLFARNDPFCRAVEKNRVGGKEYRFGTKVYQGGNTAGDYTVALANLASSGTSGINSEFVVTPGTLFSVFNVTQLEQLATSQDKYAYVKAVVSKFYDATEQLRKMFAIAAYGTGFGEIGQLLTGALLGTTAAPATALGSYSVVNGTNYMQLFQADGVTPAWDVVVKLSIGSKFQVVNGQVPNTTFWPSVNTVTVISGNIIGFTTTGSAGETWVTGNWIEIYGCSTSSNTVPLLPVGLGGWLPTLGSGRATNSAGWLTYIGTAFFGVTRNTAVDRLAGGFYKRGSEKRGDALIEGVRIARRGGGEPNMVLVNDQDYRQILVDFNAQTTYMQSINVAGKKNSNEIEKGLSDMGFQFSTNWLKVVYDSPYVPYGNAYILDMETIEFAGWSNAATPINDGISDNNPGAQFVDEIGQMDLSFKLMIEDYLNVIPGAATQSGPSAQVSLSLFGQWCIHNPAHCVIVQF